MHIKELVLDDFKSFGRKTRIPFYEDFTTISGPNGSGKSNIIDSILFALGLARTSGIRAEKLTDLIYNPDDTDEKPSGTREASVKVILDNSAGAVSRSQVVNAAGTDNVGDTEEITVKRRIKQTEDNYYSYYYLNGRSVNLSDIQDLLAQVGVAPEGYNVVMQGDVTEIINMSAGDRRRIIDEIAGVAEFDARKEDAAEELEVVRERLEEADLRIEEKRERLEQLEDERETALEYQTLKDEKSEYEGYLTAAELEEKRDRLDRITETIVDTEATLTDRQATRSQREDRVSQLEAELSELNAEIERTGEDEQLRVKQEIEEIKGEIARKENAIETATERAEEAERKRSQAFVKLDGKQEDIEELAGQIKAQKVEKVSIKAEIQDHESELAEVENEIEAVDTEYERLKTELADARDRLETAKSERNDSQREQDRLLDAARRRSNERRDLEAEIESLEETIPELEAKRTDIEAELEAANENKATIQSAVNDLRDEKYELQAEIDEIEDELSAAQQEYAELEANTDDTSSSYGRAVSTVLNSGIDGVHGAVSQLGSISGRYAVACETAAGGRLAHVVVEDDGVGQHCIEHLQSRNAGRATFLPISEMQHRSLPSLPGHTGVVDFAYNLVEFDRRYAGVFSYVLGDTLVVEDIDTARELMGEFRMATLGGDLVEKSGAMTGGSNNGTRYSFSSDTSRLEQVAERITELEDRRRSLREDLRSVESQLDDARERQSAATDQVRDIKAERTEIDERIESTEAAIEDKKAEITEIGRAREETEEQMRTIEAEIEEKDETIAGIEAEIDDLEAELRSSAVAELTDHAETLRETITDLEDEMRRIDDDLNELKLEREYAEETIDDLEGEIEAAEERHAAATERIEERKAEIGDEEARLERKHEQVAELEEELADLKDERTDLKTELQDARESYETAADAVDRAESRLESLREQKTRLSSEIEELAEQVGSYDPEEIPAHETLEREIARLEEEMAALEPVNMLAIDEYDRVSGELSDLETRRKTLTEERDAIQTRIKEFETKKRATFMDAYEGINEQFEEIFARLSDGSGTLFLEDEDDPFAGGLTMKAQPGDKPVQRLAAMSGGEKSLTALAFIFAIQRHNPAPFYALDEVDAFLDAANADAVGELIDELAGDAQFVVVSHRSALLERSERAIGVTMQGNNISAVTGIDLSGDTDREVPADD
ncbi:chromosome segregation protein SMC [Halocatena pleomorpha]|uniref:Chromosome partition protein Smc n=1 Tax=Halocatena pleomorpha TaxID=1785090 RepID=A0A3P3R654_9EURY|nr:chromosome segregation protein SMC [Halocatena pleomorpha]RRJ28043.1 chromosome segregation protein SMC [Halocatena pleomorpha]